MGDIGRRKLYRKLQIGEGVDMAVAPDMERKSVTMPKKHLSFYEAEVLRLGLLGERSSVSDLIRKAIARDVKRIKRNR